MFQPRSPASARLATPHAAPSADLPSRLGLVVLGVFTLVTLAGFATFGVNPELLIRHPGAAGFYGVAFQLFAQAHIWLSFAVLAYFLARYAGLRWLPAFAAVYAISLASELLGTTFGVPFGDYAYSPLLGPRWLDRVPIVIPLSWFAMALPSFALARALLGRVSGAGVVVLASLLLLTWDLSLDPAMSHATTYWVWGETGPYYGMPWLNLAGWYVTGVALMGALAALGAPRWLAVAPVRWLAVYYALNLLLPLGMSAAAGLWGAVIATGAVLVLSVSIAVAVGRRAAASPAQRPDPRAVEVA